MRHGSLLKPSPSDPEVPGLFGLLFCLVTVSDHGPQKGHSNPSSLRSALPPVLALSLPNGKFRPYQLVMHPFSSW